MPDAGERDYSMEEHAAAQEAAARLGREVERLTTQRDGYRGGWLLRGRQLNEANAKLQRVLALADRYEEAKNTDWSPAVAEDIRAAVDAPPSRQNYPPPCTCPSDQACMEPCDRPSHPDASEPANGPTDGTAPGPVVVCGSATQQEDLAGVAVMYQSDSSEVLWPEESDRPVDELNREWLAAIEGASLVVVLRKPDGSVGSQTTAEVIRAVERGVPVHWWMPAVSPPPMVSTAELLRRCADGRAEYAAGAPEPQRSALLTEANTLRWAARMVDGDRTVALHLLPSWRWTDDLGVPLPGACGLRLEPPATPDAAPLCGLTITDFHNDEVQHVCYTRAVCEVFTTSGLWTPACERHAADYQPGRRREFGSTADPVLGQIPPRPDAVTTEEAGDG
jgi:hypothetical protein